ncbi:helix-turn-helix transcriptional regulator [Nonomuraea salmonea]|uniref:helix-turn-helix transcriptional regulator n=1 Tax=Nonomuraea salmonea TaxID=46181 RepID=UPI002FE89785
MSSEPVGGDLDALALLHDPVRRNLYDVVASSGGDVGRGEAAEAAGVSRTLAGHHLDKLVEAGLLESGFRRPDKRGPGSGRPAKVYRRARGERSVSLPPRDYAALASVLADVVDRLGAEEQTEAVARQAGARLGGRTQGASRWSGCCASGVTSRTRRAGGCGCATARSTCWRGSSRCWCAR